MRISQSLASQIAKKLMEKKKTLQQTAKEAYRQYFTEIAEKKVPKNVMEFFGKHSEYVKTTSSIYVDGKGFNKLSVSLTKAIPSINPNCYYDHIDLSDAEVKKGKELYDAHEKMKTKNEELEYEIEATLINLRTYSNIQKEFPEAAEHLPALGLTVIVNTDALRKKLK